MPFSSSPSLPCSHSFFFSLQTWFSLFGTELLPGVVQTDWCWAPKARFDSVSSAEPRGSSSTRELWRRTLWEWRLPRKSSTVFPSFDEGEDIKLEGEEITLRILSGTGAERRVSWELLDCTHCIPVLPVPCKRAGGCAGDQPKARWPVGTCFSGTLQWALWESGKEFFFVCFAQKPFWKSYSLKTNWQMGKK